MPSRRADRYGSTPLARACEKGDMAAVQKAYEQVPEELDQADNGGFTPLQKAALEGYLNIVEFLLSKGCRKDCQSKDEGDTPLIDAVENRHVEVVKALLNSGVNPHHQNKNGKRAIDAIDFEKPGAEEIEAMLQKAMRDYVDTEDDDEPAENNPQTVSPEDKTRPDLLYLEPSIENLVNYSRKGDTVAVAHFLSSIPPNNECAVVAARGGHIDVLNLLLASGTSLEKDPDPMQHEETPLLAAIGRGHIKVIKLLLEQDNFNPTRKTRDGKTYFELSEQIRGPKWQVERELLRKHYDAYTNRKPKTKRKRSSEGSQAVAAPAHKLTERPSDRAQSPKPRKNLTSKNSSSNVDPSRRKNRPVLESSDSEEDMVRPKKSARRRSSVNSKEGQAPTKVRRMSSVKKSSSVAGASVEPPSPLKTSPDGPVSRESAGKASKPARETSDSVSKKRRKTDHHPNPLQELKVRRDRAAEADRKADDARSAESTRKAAARKIREEERRKREEAERKAREEEQHKAAEEKRKAHEEQERVAAEEERRRKAEEEAQRLEAERLERERVEEERIEQERLEKIRQECERKEREEREKREREEQLLKQLLDGLPPILARSVEYGARNRDNIDISLAINFLPLFTVELWNIDPKCDPARAKEKWILSFFVVGLLNLPDLTLNRFPAWEKRVATLTERKAFLKLYDVSYLTWGQDMPNPFEKEYSWAAAVAANKRTQDQILAMEPLYWVRLEDFRNEFTRVCEVGKIQQELQTVNVKIVTSESHIPKSLDDVFANALGGDGAKDERDPVVEMKVLATETETSAGGAGLAATTTRDVSADVTKDVKPDVEMKDTVQAADADKVKSAEDVVNNAAGDALEAKVEDSKDVVLKG
ncbi:ankyrin [Trichodelitschia bisporula]|uniref:Ankyrin n=1 Tax=Trichodelitschia bisporula TaxID=703511 RepID=A0A6G1I697_9PEZI|nr:ankyrin [Trichodelitschia bisporula]